MIILVMLSSIGYFSWIRRVFRLSFTSSVFFATCAATILMFIFGLLYIMTLGAWLIFAGGFVPAILDVFSLKKRRLRDDWYSRIKTHYWRNEYFFIIFIALSGLFFFLRYQGELGTADIWTAWYDQFYYMILNDSWSNAGYKSGDSAYCMIFNGFCYLIAKVLNNAGSKIYIYSYFLAVCGFAMPLMSWARWKIFPIVDVFALLLLGIYYKLNANVGVPVLITGLAFVLTKCLWRSKNIKSRLAALQMSAICFLAMSVLVQYTIAFVQYPVDSLLGSSIFGTVICFIAHKTRWKKYENNMWMWILPLLVITHIKPTGILFSLMLAVMICLWEMIRGLKYLFSQKRKKSVKPFEVIAKTCVVILIFVSPIAAYRGWNIYCGANGFVFKHKVRSGDVIRKGCIQIRDGINKDDFIRWQKKIEKISFYAPSCGVATVKKSYVEKNIDRVCSSFISKYDLAVKNGKEYPVYFFFISTTILLIIIVVLTLSLCRRSGNVIIFCSFWALFVMVTVLFVQIYLTPMFTTVPVRFRYVWPGLVPLWAVAVASLMITIEHKLWRGLIAFCVFLYFFMPICGSRAENGFSQQVINRPSRLGHILLAERNAGKEHDISFAGGMQDHAMYLFLVKRGLVPYREYRTGAWWPNFRFNNSSILLCDDSNPDNLLSFPEIRELKSGLYYIEKTSGGKTNCRQIYYDQEAADLLNKIYSLEDSGSWLRPPVVERDINGSFNHGSILGGSTWGLMSDGKRNCPDHYSLKWHSWGKRKLVLKTTKRAILENWCYQYVFVEDKLKLTWIMDSFAKADVLVILCKKKGKHHKHIKSLSMKTQVTEYADDKYRFEGTLDLAEYKGLDFNSYMFVIMLPPCPDGLSIYDIKMMQIVSGRLYFDPVDTVKRD